MRWGWFYTAVVEDHVQQRATDAHTAGVIDEAELAESVHEKTDPRPGGADHLGQGFLADLGDHRLRRSLFTDIGQSEQKPRQALFTRCEQLETSKNLGILVI
jgi:hypothetical protein